MQKYFDSISSAATGLPIYRAQIAVTKSDGTPVQLYSDNGVTAISQPIRTDSLGYFAFYVANGVYTLTISGPDGANIRTITGVGIFENVLNPIDQFTALAKVWLTTLPDEANGDDIPSTGPYLSAGVLKFA